MRHAAARTAFYASRFKALFWSLFGLGMVTFDLLSYFVLPTPPVETYAWAYQEPGKTIVFIALLLIFGAVMLYSGYLLVTPLPFITVDAQGLVYQPYPFSRRVIQWADVEGIMVRRSREKIGRKITMLFAIKPEARANYSMKSQIKFVVSSALMSLSADYMVALLRQYLDVTYFP